MEKQEIDNLYREAIAITLRNDVLSQQFLDELKDWIGKARGRISKADMDYILGDVEIIGTICIQNLNND